MSEKDEETFKSVDLEQQTEKTPEPDNPQESPSGTETDKPSTPSTEAKAESPPSTHTSAAKVKWTSSVEQFKLKRFFVLRPGTLDHGIEDVKALVNPTEDGAVQSVWLMAEVDHWNNEKERLVLITENTLLIFKYDFVMLNCEQIQKIPLNYIDRICHGTFCFPPRSLLTREGEGVRVFWDKLREPSFTSRWNPFSVEYPFTTFTYHPVKSANEELGRLCDVSITMQHTEHFYQSQVSCHTYFYKMSFFSQIIRLHHDKTRPLYELECCYSQVLQRRCQRTCRGGVRIHCFLEVDFGRNYVFG
uniref:Tumor protein p63 regulated 1 n=1 Tax=Cyprinus carpio TaxID=7962 RepID=A0A8C1G566_CYPCA